MKRENQGGTSNNPTKSSSYQAPNIENGNSLKILGIKIETANI